jgi:hypothetical protein
MLAYQKAQNTYTAQAESNNPNPSSGWPFNIATVDYTAIEAKADADPTVQGCRRDVMANPSKYVSEWEYGTPYKATVNQATKDFIVAITNRLNQK